MVDVERTVMEPQIQYCKTTDGVRIAFRVSGDGDGLPLLCLNSVGFSFLTPVAQKLHLVNPAIAPATGITDRAVALLDFRGCGMSDRRATEMSMDALLADVDAVIERLAWDRFALLGFGMSGPLAIRYAHDHPERVGALILRETYARASEMGRIPRMRIQGFALREDWDTYIELLAMMSYPWAAEGRAIEAALKEGVTRDVMEALTVAIPTYDASTIVGRLVVPTLVIGREDTPVPSPDMLRDLGAQIPGARVVLVGKPHADARAYEIIGEYLREQDIVASKMRNAPVPHGTAVILFADIADSTAMTERIGDAAFRAKARELDAALRERVHAKGGSVIDAKTLGDGILATFPAASQAIAAAMSFEDAADTCGLALHAGIHAGDVIREEDNVFGGAVNIAARISALSAPGEVLVSDVVRALARTSASVMFEDRGEHELKGVSDPQRVFAVRATA